jgi:hypothetical protein
VDLNTPVENRTEKQRNNLGDLGFTYKIDGQCLLLLVLGCEELNLMETKHPDTRSM